MPQTVGSKPSAFNGPPKLGDVKSVVDCACAVVNPVPLALVIWPEEFTSQKDEVTMLRKMALVAPKSPPTPDPPAAITAPVE
jgi:hypothetical protein